MSPGFHINIHRLSCLLPALAVLVLSGCCNRNCVPSAGHALPGLQTAAFSGPVTLPLPQNYTARPADILKITVYGEDDLSGEYSIGPDGAVALPLVGAVAVAGKNLAELPEAIASAYRGEYLLEPKVSVEVKGRL